jgi:hypothetical protein
VKVVTTGSAPISAEVLDFLKIALACDIFEGKFFRYSIIRYLTIFIPQGKGDSAFNLMAFTIFQPL